MGVRGLAGSDRRGEGTGKSGPCLLGMEVILQIVDRRGLGRIFIRGVTWSDLVLEFSPEASEPGRNSRETAAESLGGERQ